MSDEIVLETPVDVDPVVDPAQDPVGDDPTDPNPATPQEPYLSVNERTVYKTKDDAIRGYNESASRIAQLSHWEKQAKAYGLTEPGQLKAVADELLQARKELAEAKKQATAPKVDSTDPKAKETQQVKEYLKNLGYISKEDQEAALKEFRDQIAEMKQSGARSEELRFQNQEAEAKNDLGGWLSKDGVKDGADGRKSAVVATLIKDWVNNDDDRVAKWASGGIGAKALIKEGYDFVMQDLGWKVAPVTAAAAPQLKPTDPGYAAAKAKAMAANKKLPAPGTAKGAEKNTPKQRGHINAETHERAYKVFMGGE